MQYQVHICRTERRTHAFIVDAHDATDAEDKAMNDAYDHDFTYSAIDREDYEVLRIELCKSETKLPQKGVAQTIAQTLKDRLTKGRHFSYDDDSKALLYQHTIAGKQVTAPNGYVQSFDGSVTSISYHDGSILVLSSGGVQASGGSNE